MWRPIEKRPVGRPRYRLERRGLQRFSTFRTDPHTAQDRKRWQLLVSKAKILFGSLSQRSKQATGITSAAPKSHGVVGSRGFEDDRRFGTFPIFYFLIIPFGSFPFVNPSPMATNKYVYIFLYKEISQLFKKCPSCRHLEYPRHTLFPMLINDISIGKNLL